MVWLGFVTCPPADGEDWTQGWRGAGHGALSPMTLPGGPAELAGVPGSPPARPRVGRG